VTDAEWVVLTRDLQATRKKKGLTLDQAQQATRISVAHLTAMEEGRIDAFRKGPFREGHLRAYRAFLGLDSEDAVPTVVAPPTARPPRKPPTPPKTTPTPPSTPESTPEIPLPPPPTPHRMPLGVVRAIAMTALGSLVVMTGVWLMNVQPSQLSFGPAQVDVPGAESADQHVSVCAKSNARLKIVVDGQVTVDQQVANGQCFTGDGRDSVEVHVDKVKNWRVTYNGRTMVSQGQQDEPRILKFIDG
jgi:hypothetical protein